MFCSLKKTKESSLASTVKSGFVKTFICECSVSFLPDDEHHNNCWEYCWSQNYAKQPNWKDTCKVLNILSTVLWWWANKKVWDWLNKRNVHTQLRERQCQLLLCGVIGFSLIVAVLIFPGGVVLVMFDVVLLVLSGADDPGLVSFNVVGFAFDAEVVNDVPVVSEQQIIWLIINPRRPCCSSTNMKSQKRLKPSCQNNVATRRITCFHTSVLCHVVMMYFNWAMNCEVSACCYESSSLWQVI